MAKNTDRKLKIYLGYIILVILIVSIGLIFYEYQHKYMNILKDQEKLRLFIISYGKYSILVFLIMQIMQVVAFFIPGEVIQIAGGYVFGTIIGSIISIIGIGLGSIIVFFIANKFGRAFVQKIISEKKLKFFSKILNKDRQNKIIFILYLIPGLPKDVLAYVCGITDISIKDFIIYSNLGRLPCIVLSAYFGSKIFSKNVTVPITIAVMATILFAIGVLKGEVILKKISNNKIRKK